MKLGFVSNGAPDCLRLRLFDFNCEEKVREIRGGHLGVVRFADELLGREGKLVL